MIKILIVDDEEDILDINTFSVEDIFCVPHEISTAKSGNEAIKILEKNEIDLCICDHNMPNGTGADVCEFIYSKKLKTKHVLCSTVLPEELPNTYSNEKMYFNIVKPDITIGIEKLYHKFIKSSAVIDSAVQDSKTFRYVPISIKLLFIVGELPCDIYLKINDEKYLKSHNAEDFFKTDDFDKYKEKGVDVFYVKSNGDDKDLLNVINATLGKILNSSEHTPEERLMNSHLIVTEMLKKFGFTDEACNIAKESIKKSLSDILKNEISHNAFKKISLMGEFPSQLYVMQSTLCGILTKKISWCSEATLHKQITASFFQDLALDSVKLMKIYDYEHFLSIKDTLRDAEIESYLNHPVKSRELVLKIKSIPADVDKIILEQHEMPNGNGFPRKLASKAISPVSAMFILTGYFSKVLLLEQGANIETVFDQIEAKGYSKGNFKDSFNALKVIF